MGIFDRKNKDDAGQKKTTDFSTPEGMGEAFAALAESQKAIANGITDLANSNKQQFAALAAAVQSSGGNATPAEPNKTDAPPAAAPTDDEFESMSNKDMFELITKRVEEVVGGMLDKQIGDVRKDISTENAKKQVEAAKEKFEDFDDWKAEMAQVYKDNPNLTNIEDIYHLARSRNPEKVKEMEKAAEEAAAAEKEKEKGKEPPEEPIDFKKVFGGFSPDQSQGREPSPSETADGKPASTRDVVGNVLDQMFDQIPAAGALLRENS